jgi:microcystin-dependent protein
MAAYVANVWGEPLGKPVELPYIKKTGDTATGLIVFDGGIETNIGTSTFNGPAIFNDDVTFNPSSTVIIDGALEITGPTLTVTSNVTEFNGNLTEFNGPQVTFNGPIISIDGGGNTDLNITAQTNFDGWPITVQNATLDLSLNANIQYPDNTSQISAYTGAAALAGNYPYANITINSNGAISGIASDPAPVDLLPLNNTWTGTNDFTAGITTTTTTYGDGTVQDSAFTGAAALAGAYTTANITINNNGAITSISNGVIPIPETNPLGSMLLYAGPLLNQGSLPSPPINIVDTNYLHCNGAVLEQADYPDLFNLIGLTYTFNAFPGQFQCPDLRNRMPMGAVLSQQMQINVPGYTSLTYGGSQVITTGQLPNHTHSFSTPTSQYVNNVTQASNTSVGGSSVRGVTGQQEDFPDDTGGISGFAGQGYFVPNFTCLNYIIRALP